MDVPTETRTYKQIYRICNRDLENPDFVGPLYNINRTKADLWDGPK